MDLKQLDSKEIERVYNTHMKIDFPIEELKPLDIIQRLLEKQNYACYGLYEKNELQAYAFLAIQKSYLLIDYYAVCSEHRNKGIGSKFLKLIKEQFKDYEGIMVEVEKVECAPNETEKTIRRRRIDFYKRNGMRMTSISILLFNVDFRLCVYVMIRWMILVFVKD